MEKHERLIKTAKKEIELGDHLLFVTYPMIKEIKFLLAIAGHIIKAAQTALEALLEYERYYKRLDAFPHNFALEISIFRQKQLEKKYSFDPRFFRLLSKLLEIHKFDKESVVRFKRGEKYILTSSEYNMTVLDVNSIKRYSSLTKKFVSKIEKIVTVES